MKANHSNWGWGLLRTVAGLSLAVVVSSCATTQQAPISSKEGAVVYCPFLGPTICSQLTATETPGRFSSANVSGGTESARAQLRYFNPNAHWTSYNQVMIAPVTFWAGDDSKVSAADQQALTTYFHSALVEAFSKKMTVVDAPGPGVITVQVAIDDVQSATPGLRSVSMIVPQARALGMLKYLATGTYAFVGGAQAEAKITDSVTGQVLWAGVDRRVGGGSLTTAAQWQWGDVENAMDTWSQVAADRVSGWCAGTLAPGATPAG
jgi:hypothetical protein